MQIKSKLIKSKQIILVIIASVVLFMLIGFIFFSALQSSSIFEKLFFDVYEIDLLTRPELKADNSPMYIDMVVAEKIVDIFDQGIFRYKMILSDQGNDEVNRFYYMVRNRLSSGAAQIVITNKEYLIMQRSIQLIRSSIIEASREQKRALSILFVLLLITAGVLLLVLIGTAVKLDKEKREHQYEKMLAKNISESEKKLYNLLSSELHDDIGQMLVFLKLKLIETKSSLSKDIDPILDSVRNLSHNLKIPEFSSGQFTASVEALISQFSTVSSIRVEYTLSDFHNELYPDYYPIIIFRVIQECLQNAVKHSKAENIRINLVESAPFLIIRYVDDGVGIDSNTVVLESVENRAKLLNAELKIDTETDKGLRIVIKIPFSKAVD